MLEGVPVWLAVCDALEVGVADAVFVTDDVAVMVDVMVPVMLEDGVLV